MKSLGRVAPMLNVHSLDETERFYVDVLGFTLDGKWGDDMSKPTWMSLSYGDVNLMFVTTWTDIPAELHGKPTMTGYLYFYPDDVDAYAAQVRAKATLDFEPEDQEYGMRDFGIRDPNGYYLMFGSPVAE